MNNPIFRIYKRYVRIEFDTRPCGGRFANALGRNEKPTFWLQTEKTDKDPEVLFKKISKGTYEEYDLPMDNPPTYCVEYQVVDDSECDPDSLDDYSLGIYIINHNYREPRFELIQNDV